MFNNCVKGSTAPFLVVMLLSVLDIFILQLKKVKLKYLVSLCSDIEKKAINKIGLDQIVESITKQEVVFIQCSINEEIFCIDFISNSKCEVDHKTELVKSRDEYDNLFKAYKLTTAEILEYKGFRIEFNDLPPTYLITLGDKNKRRGDPYTYLILENFRHLWDTGDWTSKEIENIYNSSKSGLWSILAYLLILISNVSSSYNSTLVSGDFGFVDFCRCSLYYGSSSRAWYKLLFFLMRERGGDDPIFWYLDIILGMSFLIPFCFEIAPIPLMIITCCWPYCYIVFPMFLLIYLSTLSENKFVLSFLIGPAVSLAIMFLASSVQLYGGGGYVDSLTRPFQDRSSLIDYMNDKISILMHL